MILHVEIDIHIHYSGSSSSISGRMSDRRGWWMLLIRLVVDEGADFHGNGDGVNVNEM